MANVRGIGVAVMTKNVWRDFIALFIDHAFLPKFFTLGHAKAVLLIDDGHA